MDKFNLGLGVEGKPVAVVVRENWYFENQFSLQ
jgi:hypothetical protein